MGRRSYVARQTQIISDCIQRLYNQRHTCLLAFTLSVCLSVCLSSCFIDNTAELLLHCNDIVTNYLTGKLPSVLYYSLYLPSERSETGGYVVFTYVCLSVCVSVRTQSSVQQCVSAISKLAPDCRDMHGPYYGRSIGSLWTQEIQYL